MVEYITNRGREEQERALQLGTAHLAQLCHDRPDWATRGSGSMGGVRMNGEVRRQELIEAVRITEMQKTLGARTAPLPVHTNELQLGLIGDFKYADDTDSTQYHVDSYLIVGINEGDPKATPPRMSYQCELADSFLRQAVGYTAECMYKKKVRTIELVGIRRPE